MSNRYNVIINDRQNKIWIATDRDPPQGEGRVIVACDTLEQAEEALAQAEKDLGLDQEVAP